MREDRVEAYKLRGCPCTKGKDSQASQVSQVDEAALHAGEHREAQPRSHEGRPSSLARA
jgi:hypothetical protein